MDWLQFLSSVVGSLAWPATVLALVVLLRAPVTRVLLTLTRLKYKDLELDFGRELAPFLGRRLRPTLGPQGENTLRPFLLSFL